MRFVPKLSVGAQLTAAIFLAIVLAWVLSAGTSSYVQYQRLRSLREQMLARPDLYPVPIPEPRFTFWDFLVGPRPNLALPPSRPPALRHPYQPQPVPQSGQAFPPAGPPAELRPYPPSPATPPTPVGPSQPNWQPGQPNVAPPPDRQLPPEHRPGVGGMLLIRAAIALLLALAAGKLLSWRFSRRLNELAKGAGAFNAGDLRYRVPEAGDDEFAQVAAAMNKMAERVARQIQDLEDDAEKRRQFLADVAHELRGPVATIRTMAGALRDGVADEPDRKERAIASLVRTSERLLQLVNDLLDLARLDLKELPIHRRRVDLRELAAAAVESRRDAASQAGITLHGVEAGQAVMALVDPDRFTQVLDNLLDNAISYAGSGAQVRVTVEAGDKVQITVADTGRGIPSAHLRRVFEPFYRVDTARTAADGHSGLGLRISLGLVRAMGGELKLTSAEGEGTKAVIAFECPSTRSGRNDFRS